MRILITAGPTREYLDTVRYISNASTGKMGYAVAEAARARGHEVVLISGPVSVSAPDVEVVRVTGADEMLKASLEAFERCDAAVMTAAVSDWRPAVRLMHKAPKGSSRQTLELEPTPDICATLGARKGGRIVVGFALQDADPHRQAEEKMIRKRCDAIVLNSPAAMAGDRARVEVKVQGEEWGEAVEATKEEIGVLVVKLVERLASE